MDLWNPHQYLGESDGITPLNGFAPLNTLKRIWKKDWQMSDHLPITILFEMTEQT